MKERIDKVLANNALGTRKDVKRLVRSGAVLVNGVAALTPEQKVDADADEIVVSGQRLQVRRNVYLMLNKPAGYVCSTKSDTYQSVFCLVPPEVPRKCGGGDLACVGRLDADTEGLLLLTTDGQLNHRLTAPKQRVPKVYAVHLALPVSQADRAVYAQKLSQGIRIAADGHDAATDCLPASLVWRDDDDGQAVCELTVYEGKYHEIKRMFLALGNRVSRLSRLSVGPVSLDPALAPGDCRELTPQERDLLFAL